MIIQGLHNRSKSKFTERGSYITYSHKEKHTTEYNKDNTKKINEMRKQ